ncbi:MAG: tRNA lysidine(34) synthetase TilS [Candidatus Cloacimonadaceae bacterium]|nr:tRNA lysidine(34) synthetase TilS [Candidatus Cloacimonadaceae bacterium]
MRVLDLCLKKLHNYLREKQLVKAGDKVLIGISGGADSMAMAYLFSRVRSLMHITLLAVHINHQLRGEESDLDEDFVKGFCLDLNLPLIVRRIKLAGGGDLENRARVKRFEVFHQLLDIYRFDRIALAHHKNDQAETMLMNLMRGAGINGLAGIKPKSGAVVHPMLCFGKEEILELLSDELIPWREDSTNRDSSHRRNFIRGEILPLLSEKINPRLVENLAMQAEIFQAAEELLKARSIKHLKRINIEQGSGRLVLNILQLMALNSIERYYLLRLAYSSLSGNEADFFRHSYASIIALLDSKGSKELSLAHGVIVRKQYQELHLTLETGDEKHDEEPLIVEEDRTRVVYLDHRFSFKHLRVLPRVGEYDKNVIVLDSDKISFPIQIRSRKPGDRFQPTGMTGFKKLKDFFIDEKVPKYERDNIPVFDDGEKIIWIAGYRVDQRACVDEHSSRFLQIVAEPVHEKPKRAASRKKDSGGDHGSNEL